jgi:hypothetical protein
MISNNNAAIVLPSQSSTAAVTNDIRSVKPPVVVPNDWAWAWWVGGTILALAAAIMAYRRWRKQLLTPRPVTVVPPHLRAKQKLAAALQLISDPKAFCTAVSDTLRVYLEERFRFHAPERTTEEFLHELQSTHHLTPDQKISLVDFLQSCDLVKFARFEPEEQSLRALHGSALRLVEETYFEPAATPTAVAGSAAPPSLSISATVKTAASPSSPPVLEVNDELPPPPPPARVSSTPKP